MSYSQAVGTTDIHNRDIMKIFKKFIKNQSAMEYLMTYGWSILIIAVVLGALSFLGVFNPMTFTPKATVGGCQVIKNTQLNVSNLAGSCNNQIPQYVAQFAGNDPSNVITQIADYQSANSITITAWVKAVGTGTPEGTVVALTTYGNTFSANIIQGVSLGYSNVGVSGAPTFGECCSHGAAVGNEALGQNTWYFLAGTMSSNGEIIYLNGLKNGTSTISENLVGANQINIGIRNGDSFGDFKGMIADVQVYDEPLSNTSILSLYQEGIGGVPVDLQHLIAWYPLNGNANDYSGNNNDGIVGTATFTSDWYNGYSQP